MGIPSLRHFFHPRRYLWPSWGYRDDLPWLPLRINNRLCGNRVLTIQPRQEGERISLRACFKSRLLQ